MTGYVTSSGLKKIIQSKREVSGLLVKRKVWTSGREPYGMEEAKRYTWVRGLSPRFSKYSAHVEPLECWVVATAPSTGDCIQRGVDYGRWFLDKVSTPTEED